MKKFKYLSVLFLLFILFFLSCNFEPECNQLRNFSSFRQAVVNVEHAKFNLKDEIYTPDTSWIKDISYYSCDGKVGYLIYKAKGKVYIHYKVPIGIWRKFKRAKSIGRYYNKHIKKKYRLKLSK